MMGDHSKTAINTMFNTGTVVGFQATYLCWLSSEIYSFIRLGRKRVRERIQTCKALETAKAVFARRDKDFKKDEEMFETIFNLTKEDRSKRGY
jgi:hypothetical protein